MMESPRRHPRASSMSSTVSQSSFESRYKSPLSITSSVDYGSSRTSQDSVYSSGSNRNSKHDVYASSPIPPTALSHGQRPPAEAGAPLFTPYGAGSDARQLPTLMIPQKLTSVEPRTNYYGGGLPSRNPRDTLKELPEEIMLLIVAELKRLHLHVGNLSCSTCWLRDGANLGLASKKWWSVTRCILYQDIQLIGPDSILHTKKRLKTKHGTRLKMLRRTLRARPALANYVKSLKVPSMPATAKLPREREEYLDLVASLVMACPNLERLPGFYPAYKHEYTRLVHAMSTRKKLREAVWNIDPSPFQRQHRYDNSDTTQDVTNVLAPGPLLPEQSIDFLKYHSGWFSLKTLFLHCNPGGTIDSLLFTDTFRSLPSLENLHVSSFPAASFNDNNLLLLPALTSLRLDNLPGITAAGLSSYGNPDRTDSLTTLSLISLQLLSLPALARMFSHMKLLTRFTFSQESSPSLPFGEEIYLYPYLASPTLKWLHWEFTNPDDSKATDILAKSIALDGFPLLRTIRAPNDYEGTLQKLCRPRDRIELPGDRYRNLGTPGSKLSPTSAAYVKTSLPSPTWPKSYGTSVASPTRSVFSLSAEDRKSSYGSVSDSFVSGGNLIPKMSISLAIARRIAQHRIDLAASLEPQYQIVVWDENGRPVERHAVGNFIGRVESNIHYSLRPDVYGSDESVVGIEKLFDGGEESNGREGCTGSWNLEAGDRVRGKGGSSTGKGKQRWWHTERGRWTEVELEKFFSR